MSREICFLTPLLRASKRKVLMQDQILANLEMDKIFVLEGTNNWTYKDCKRNILCLNEYLIKNELRKVLICLNQGFVAYSCVIGSYLSGATFCCINTNDPLARKLYFVSNFEPDIIICNHEDALNESSIATPTITPQQLFGKNQVIDSPSSISHHNNEIAYVLYTSGTTGLPKGVKIRRKSINDLVNWAGPVFNITKKDVCSQFASLSFDMSIFDIFTSVSAGATLVPFASLTDKLFPGKLIKKHGITFWNSVPSVIDILAKGNQLNSETLMSLRTMKFGGDKVYPSQLENLFGAIENLRIIITYGPTEATIFCTYLQVQKSDYLEFADNIMAIGRPISGANIFLDKTDDGVGEIVVYGECVGDGYIAGEKRLQAFKRVNINGKSERAYFTGDYGRFKDGVLYFLGRKDSQIKINGNRVDLSEIDYTARLMGCDSTYTIFYKGKIILFYESSKYTIREVENFLNEKLPTHFRPSIILKKDIIPKTANDKFDRIQLIAEINQLFEGL